MACAAKMDEPHVEIIRKSYNLLTVIPARMLACFQLLPRLIGKMAAG